MPKYKVVKNALSYKGNRYEIGDVIELDKKDADAIGKDYLKPANKAEKEEKETEEKDK